MTTSSIVYALDPSDIEGARHLSRTTNQTLYTPTHGDFMAVDNITEITIVATAASFSIHAQTLAKQLFGFLNEEVTLLEDIYLLMPNAGRKVPGSLSFAQQLAQQLEHLGFLNLEVHAIAPPVDLPIHSIQVSINENGQVSAHLYPNAHSAQKHQKHLHSPSPKSKKHTSKSGKTKQDSIYCPITLISKRDDYKAVLALLYNTYTADRHNAELQPHVARTISYLKTRVWHHYETHIDTIHDPSKFRRYLEAHIDFFQKHPALSLAEIETKIDSKYEKNQWVLRKANWLLGKSQYYTEVFPLKKKLTRALPSDEIPSNYFFTPAPPSRGRLLESRSNHEEKQPLEMVTITHSRSKSQRTSSSISASSHEKLISLSEASSSSPDSTISQSNDTTSISKPHTFNTPPSLNEITTLGQAEYLLDSELKKLEDKIKNFGIRGEKKAGKEASALLNELKTLKQQFFSPDPQKKTLWPFDYAKQSRKAIDNARKTLNSHRGGLMAVQGFANFFGVLGSVLSLGTANIYSKKKSGSACFFKIPTDTNRILDGITNVVNKIEVTYLIK